MKKITPLARASASLIVFQLAFALLAEAAPAKKAATQAPQAQQPAQATPAAASTPYSELDSEDRQILRNGEISDGAYIGGGVAGTLLGLGIGHAIQGRYSNPGWIFTVGELGSYTLMAVGAVNCVEKSLLFSSGTNCSTAPIIIGAVAFVGFRVWEIIDLWATPPVQNRRYRELKSRVGVSPFVLPDLNGTKLSANYGLSLQLSF